MTQQLLPAGTQVPATPSTDPGIQGTPATPTPAKRKGRGTSPAFVIGSAMLGLVLLLAAVVPLLPGFDPFGQASRQRCAHPSRTRIISWGPTRWAGTCSAGCPWPVR